MTTHTIPLARLLPLVILLSALFTGATDPPPRQVSGIYRERVDTTLTHSRFEVWIVDGAAVRKNIFPEFVYGTNPERNPFVPLNEVWIDNSISAEEFNYTLQHELYERDLMTYRGLGYLEAHDSALQLEHRLRERDYAFARLHESQLPMVSTLDADSMRYLPLPDSIQLRDIYREYLGSWDGVHVWIVDGPTVRRTIYPDFGFSAGDLSYYFIPKSEIWIDNSMSAEELAYSIHLELEERKLMMGGVSDDSAYVRAVETIDRERERNRIVTERHPPVVVEPPLERDTGTGVKIREVIPPG